MRLNSEDTLLNKRDSYECEKCGEKFRLGSTLSRHTCDPLLLLEKESKSI